MEIKVLARWGTAVRETTRKMGLSPNTVHRYLRDGRPPVTSNASHARRSSSHSKTICPNVNHDAVTLTTASHGQPNFTIKAMHALVIRANAKRKFYDFLHRD